MKLLETVVDTNGNYKWLVQEEIIESPDSNDISVKNLDFENPKPLPVKKVYKLLDPNLLECQKCHAIVPMNKGITPPLCPEEYGGCGRKSVFAVYTPEPLMYWKPIPCYSVKLEPEDASLLYDIVKLIKQCIVFDSEIEYYVFALWCMATWKYEEFDTAPYLHFIGPIESGKTRALELIDRLAYRPFECARASIASIPRIADLYHASLTIDEADTLLKNSKSETAMILKAILKAGYRRGQHYVVADKEDQKKVVSYDVFGFKAFASEQMFDTALHSRSIVFWMKEAKPEIKDLKEVEKDFDEFRYRLLCYRYENGPPHPYPENEIDLYGRIRELFMPIIRMALDFEYDIKEIIKFAKQQKHKQLEHMYSSEYADVLSFIYETENRIDAPDEITLKEIGENCALTPQRVGYILRDLDLPTKRMSYGKVVDLLDTNIRKQLNYLYQKFGIGRFSVRDTNDI